ncbi:MAG TPA: IS1634 family transposase [Candidatus Limnocylindria bacterium]|nr:IS1634 family transposase [Candidatus Limnocylindria bacterium]
MYIRKSSRTYKGKTYSNYVLVESVLTPKGPRQKIICSLGDLRPRPQAEWLELAHKLTSALSGQADLLASPAPDSELQEILAKMQLATPPSPAASDLLAVHVDQVRTEQSREAGPVHAGYQFWLRLGLDEILAQAGLGERVRQLACAMTLNRLIHPASELAMPDWIRSTALSDILQVDFQTLAEDALYRNLDRLHAQRVAIEAALAERERTLFALDQTVFLYDVTSTFFEGRALANPKARRGYSRDHRPDCKQVLIGLAVNRDGFPLAHEVFAGNRHDSTTLDEMLTALDKRVGLQPGQTVVVDRGLSGEENVKRIVARKLHYLVAEPYGARRDWVEEFENDEDFVEVKRETSPTNPFQRKSTIQVKMRRAGGEIHVLCLSSERQEKDRAIRQAHEKKLWVDLEKLAKRVAKGKGRGTKPAEVLESIGRLKERYSRVARYYRMEYDSEKKVFHHSLDEAKRARAEKLDGSYLLKTDRQDLTADEAWRIYTLLTRAEAAFRTLKSPLGERPIFHHKEGRVEAHIFLCVLAYHLLISIEKTLLNAGVHTCWATVRETLKTHQINTVVLPADGGLVLRIRQGSTPEPVHRELYQKLRIGSEIVPPRKTWSRVEVGTK